jgi:hypothetical protein
VAFAVIAGQPLNPSLPDPVDSAVARVRDNADGPYQPEESNGRRHSARFFRPSFEMYPGGNFVQKMLHRLNGCTPGHLPKTPGHQFNGARTGDITAGASPHPVTNRKEPAGVQSNTRIFIPFADSTTICSCCRYKPHSSLLLIFTVWAFRGL